MMIFTVAQMTAKKLYLSGIYVFIFQLNSNDLFFHYDDDGMLFKSRIRKRFNCLKKGTTRKSFNNFLFSID